MTADAIDRAEALELISACVGAVCGRYENNVPLVALDVLKVLHE